MRCDTPDAVLALMESQGGELGLCLDFGNWEESKYRNLAAIAPLAESCHANAISTKRGGPIAMTTCDAWTFWRMRDSTAPMR